MSQPSEKSEPGSNTAPVKPAKPPKPAKLVSPSAASLASISAEEFGLSTSPRNNSSDAVNEKSGGVHVKQNETAGAVKPHIPPRGSPEATRSAPSGSEASTEFDKNHEQSQASTETPTAPDIGAPRSSPSSTRSSIPPVAFITLPGTPGHEQDDGLSSPLHSPPAPSQPENPDSSVVSPPAASSSGSEVQPKARPTAAPAKDGRALPARPKTLRREHRAATVSGPAPQVTQVVEPPQAAPSVETEADSDAKPPVEVIEKPEEKENFSVVLMIDPVTGLPSPRKSDAEEKSDFDPSSPFGIASMSEETPTVPVPPRKHTVKIPLPPTTTNVDTETRQQRSRSVALPSDGKRHIPLPPQTTPARVAPLVVPAIPGVFIDHDIEKDEKEAEKRAKKEKKGMEKQEKRELHRGVSASGMALPASPPTHHIHQSMDKAKESPRPNTAGPVHHDVDILETSPPSSPRIAAHEKMVASESSSSIQSTSEAEKKVVPATDAAPSPSLRHSDKDKDKDKKEKEKDKDKEKEKEDKKEKDKDHSKGIFSKFTGKLKGKKQNKTDEEAAKSVQIAATASVIEESEELDPLLSGEALTPSVTPREGAIGENTMPTTDSKEHEAEDKKTAESEDTTSSGEKSHSPPAASNNSNVNELELHKLVLISQIKSMEELHSRLKSTIAEEQQTLSESRKSGRDRSKSIGSSPSSSSVVSQGKSSPNETPSPKLGIRSVSPASANHKAFTAQRFVSIPEFNLKVPADGNPDSVFGFKQKLSETDHGSVYACRHFQSGKMVIVRILKTSAENQKKLREKMNVIKQLENDAIGRVLAVQQFGDELWIVSEYCPIGSLKTLLDSHFLRLDESSIRIIARACLSGLAFLHSTQLVHGSLSLSNILIDSIGNVKLCDYMLNRIIEHDVEEDFSGGPQLDIKALALALIEALQGPVSLEKALDPEWKLDLPNASDDLKDFLTKCLTTFDASASDMLQHPFILSYQSNTPLIDMIADTLTKIRSNGGGDPPSQFPTRSRQELDSSFPLAGAAVPKASITSAAPKIPASPTSVASSSAPSMSQLLEQFKAKLDAATDEILKDAPADSIPLVKQLRDSCATIAEDILKD
jgi:serine/threonine protein kinase